ncbi:MAG: ABC transporter permease [Bacteroidota bacterium]|nr:ABC transporter permease [Bacteroidota bacterium]
MFKNYFKSAWRNLIKNKANSFINIIGLSTGMAVAILIGLWIWSEWSFDTNFDNYNLIAKLEQNVSFTSDKTTYDVLPMPLAEELRNKYPDFKAVSLSKSSGFIVNYKDEKFSEQGNYVQPAFTGMMSLKMVAGNRNGLQDMNSILISQSLATKLFVKENAINKIVKLNNKLSVKVSGVYKDMPDNSSFKDLDIIAPWNLLVANDDGVKSDIDKWDNNSYNIYVLLTNGADFKNVSAKIKDIRVKMDNPPSYKPEFFLHPMSKWHLYSEFKNGVISGGLIDYVWMFGIIGVFVLLLACINFMNLSTARSEKRAKEVGIRKAIGAMRRQLILQFFSESVLVAFISFLFSLLIVRVTLPFFNQVSGKNMSVLWFNPWFWFIGIVFSFLTGILAGSYPSLFLSAFKPVKVLKGTFRAGRFAVIPRRVLIVLQFTVSVILIIGTIIVFRQIEYVKDRPVGYSRNGLIEVEMNTPDLNGHYNALRNDLLNSGGASEMSESSGSVTVQYGGMTDIQWKGKKPDEHPLLMSNNITHDYGKTVGWQIAQGRDFSRDFASDTSSIILNESAVKVIGFKDPVGELVTVHGKNYKVVGVIKDMLKESPFDPVSPSFFLLNYYGVNIINIRLTPTLGTEKALAKVSDVFKKYNPSSPLIYKFVDKQFAKKFDAEERIGKLASFFAVLAIFISCLGLFGMASFMAEQRIKEIGVRKVLGASVFNLWGLLSKEFVILILVSLLIAIPVAFYFMHNWLQDYQYRTTLSWWIFAAAGLGALMITLITVSFQSIKAAMANPVKSLRTE